ncbi:MAG TPA: Nif3-like dinuclear metal center hexameric protein [Clostridiaceae bacterium]|nr:Nif3-like dinuclear metal center hexameric protein [Clostridiaceae bacterium]
MSVKCKQIIDIAEEVAPAYLAMKYDNVGLLIGDENSMISSILISLDINEKVIDEAIEDKCNMIISHHPLIFNPLKSINVRDPKGKMIHKLINNNINVYAAHTNLDCASNGINDFLMRKLDLENVELMGRCYREKYYKVAVYVPEDFSDKVREAMCSAGAGAIGKYRNCTYNISGEGTFMPLAGSSPFIGNVGHTEHVRETKVETITDSKRLNTVISAMLGAHPYEKPAYDIYLLENDFKTYGLGRAGYLDKEIRFGDLCERVKKMLNIEYLRATGNIEKTVRKVGICSGSGSDLIEEAFNIGCDAFITGDITYHHACDAENMGMCLIDAGHFETENADMPEFCRIIKGKITECNYDVDVLLSKKNSSPFYKV